MKPLLPFLAILALAHPVWAGPAADTDNDGVYDVLDPCLVNASAPNPCGFDTDGDGYGNACDGDFNQDGVVNGADIPLYVGDINSGTNSGIGSDMNCDGVVASADIPAFVAQLLQGFPGPSGLACAGTVPCP